MASTIHEITADQALWEKMPFDTKRSFEAFSRYYFPQPSGQRSINEAYRKATGKRRKANGRLYEAPTNWIRWATAKNGNHEQIYIRIRYEDGREKVRNAYTWAERAEAWDTQIRADRFRRQREAQERIDDEILEGLEEAAKKLKTAVLGYKVTGDETLQEITLGLARVIDTRNKFFDPEGEDDKPGEISPDSGADMVSQLEKVKALQDLIDKAKGRKEAAENAKPG